MKWRKLPAEERRKAEAFLIEKEKLCVAASSRFLHIDENHGHVWYICSPEGKINSLLIQCRRILFPVFSENAHITGPHFLNRLLGKVHVHAVQGLCRDAELLETLMEDQGYFAAERIDYHLMSLDADLRPDAAIYKNRKSGPADLVIRKPDPKDEESLFNLQAAYEKEEVIPGNSVFNPASCRLGLKRILSSEQVLVAELDGQVVGKINTSAESFTRFQIGGVYVRPDCRGMGIGIKMTEVFCESLLAQGKGLTLFVKKRNAAAVRVYHKAGFGILADYRISYF